MKFRPLDSKSLEDARQVPEMRSRLCALGESSELCTPPMFAPAARIPPTETHLYTFFSLLQLSSHTLHKILLASPICDSLQIIVD